MTIGISKGITKENIVNITLELIRDKENIRSVNLREIARALGCAHTNLYNHFADLDGIFWECNNEVLLSSLKVILTGMDGIGIPKTKLEQFYRLFIEFYIQNKGWFRLIWMEKLQGLRPEKNIIVTDEVLKRYISILKNIFNELFQKSISDDQVMNVFHTVHCYLYGEACIYISGRGLISEETAFKEFVLKACVNLTELLVLSIE